MTKGGILLSVHADDSDWTKRAKAILERTGAEDISSPGETKGDVERRICESSLTHGGSGSGRYRRRVAFAAVRPLEPFLGAGASSSSSSASSGCAASAAS